MEELNEMLLISTIMQTCRAEIFFGGGINEKV